jgi:hypothetical protein
MESRFGYSDSLWTAVKNAAPKTWILERQKVEHESHISLPFLATYLGLRDMFHDYAIESAPESPTYAALAYYHDLEKSYASPITPPKGLLRQVLEDFEMEGQAKPAADAWKMLVDGYGMPDDSADWKQRLAKLATQPPLAETVEGLITTPRPASIALKAIIGEWRGQEWINEDDKHDFTLRLVDSAGVVTGEAINSPAPGVVLKMPLQYLKITADGFTWGYMNGMRPRGMLLFEGKMKDGALTGTMRFGGIRFTRPPGEPGPPTVRFEIRKAN